MNKIKVVYDKITGTLINHVWNLDGTVDVDLSETPNILIDTCIVSMVDVLRVDFDNNRIREDKTHG